jgi:hypothetical protein
VEVQLVVLPEADGEPGDLVLDTMDLSEELTELDGLDVHNMPVGEVRGGKGTGEIAGLLAHVPVTGLAALVQYLQAWAARTRRTVEVSIGGDAIKIIGASREQQDRLIEVWLAHHSSGT